MAAFFDHHQYFRIKVLLFTLVLCSRPMLHESRKHKHAPVVAFFQGHCRNNICDQVCKDIDNGGYICDCYHGYHLNTDGISCTKIGEETDEIHLEKPNIIKIVGSDKDSVIDTQYNTINSNSDSKNRNNESKNSNSDSKNSNSDHKLDNTVDIDKSNLKTVDDVTLDNNIETNIHSDVGYDVHKDKYKDKNIVDHSEEHEIKIVTFDEKTDTLPLETDDLRTSETSGNENLQKLVPDLLPSSYSSSSEIEKVDKEDNNVQSIGTGVKCDEFSCLNNGNCVDDGSVFRNKLRCNCGLGTTGEKCENIVDVRYPRFYGNSYLALPVLKNGYKEVELLLEFKPTAQYGLLLFSSEFEDARSDFISVAIIDGFIEFRYDCGTGMAVLRSQSTVTIDTWNILRIYRYENIASLWLNHDQPVNGSSPGSYSRLTLRLNLYIGGYDKIESIGDKVGTSKGFVGCVQQVVVNGYRYDLRKSDLVGDAQFGSNIGECSEGLCDNVKCQNGGQCKVISADSHTCLCPLGTMGESCQHVEDVHIPEFNQHSYLEYKGLGRTALLFVEIELVIKATKPDGLILYNGYTLDRTGDFISLALHDSYLEYRFDLGTGPAVIRSPEPITLNKWHWIKISRTGMEGILEIDDQTVAIGHSQGAFTQLTVTQNLYIGGHRNFDETSKLANVTHAFEGCIQKFTLNNKVIRLIQDAISGINIESCEHACIGEPCLHQGQCIPKKDVYTCYCPLGYSGKNCQKDVDRNMLNPRFTSESYLMYSQKDIAKRIGGDKLDVQLSIKPQSLDGLLLWSGPNIIQATSDYISIGIKDGVIQFRYNLGSGEAIISSNYTRIYDGMWHYIHVKRDKQNGYLTVDGNTVTGQSKGSYTMLNTNKILYIGGMTDVSHDTLHKYTTGYNGCMKDVVLDQDYNLNLLESADNGRNIVPCS